MKHRIWLLAGCLVAANLMAQVATNAPTPAAVPVPAITDAPAAPAAEAKPVAKKPAEKAAPKKKTPAKKPVVQIQTAPLVAGPAVVVSNNVNVRAQGRLKGEVIGKLTKGDSVKVIEEVILKNSGPDEPSAWAKIVLPASVPAYLHSSFLDTNRTVKPRRLNVRGGPGENYSVIGQLQQGDSVKELEVKGEWVKIEAPASAFAFVAAQYLSQESALIAPAIAATTAPTNEVAAAPATTNELASMTEPPTIAPAPADAPALPPSTNEVAAAATPGPDASTNAAMPGLVPDMPGLAPDTEPVAEPVQEPPPPRIVQREGFVRGTGSIQAPTPFGLVNPETRRIMNYLYTTSPELDLMRYKGLRIIVTGEESLDRRWPNTPVITIQRIQVLD
jgi:uncharacterized protein YgiM (DUF1202 family)